MGRISEKRNGRGKNKRAVVNSVFGCAFAAILLAFLTGCSNTKEDSSTAEITREESIDDKLAQIMELNPDIFGWIYVPDTIINAPLLQNSDGDDEYYLYHNYDNEFDINGSVFIESANLRDMTDFNEIIYGKANESTGFSDLYKFKDKAFFDSHETIYVYIDGNALTYEIILAYERENTNILEQYDLTYASGCSKFIEDMYGARSMNKYVRDGWDDVIVPENFLITLTALEEDNADKQYVVVACLVGDAAGTIDRWFDVEE
ncbi:MAG: class B sortase [Butyrivibrio sp.]|nr:class B sortase [Butyrivibrio sp.]